MSTEQDHNMNSDDDIPHDDGPLMSIRRSSALSTGIFTPGSTRSQPSITSATTSTPQQSLTSDISPLPKTASRQIIQAQVLSKQVDRLMTDLQGEKEDKRRIKKLRAQERKEIGELKTERRELRTRLRESDAQLRNAEFDCKRQKEQLGILRGADKEKRLMQQIEEQDQEIQRYKAEHATNNDGAIRELMKRLEGEIMTLQAARATPPKVDVGTQTEEDGLAEKITALKRMLG